MNPICKLRQQNTLENILQIVHTQSYQQTSEYTIVGLLTIQWDLTKKMGDFIICPDSLSYEVEQLDANYLVNCHIYACNTQLKIITHYFKALIYGVNYLREDKCIVKFSANACHFGIYSRSLIRGRLPLPLCHETLLIIIAYHYSGHRRLEITVLSR